MSGKTRSLYGTAFKHFINSLKPRRTVGNLVGEDYHGNKYYEIPAEPRKGKRNPQRWYVPVKKDQFEQKFIPSEWDAWLRLRRSEAPNDQEVAQNLAISNLKKENAIKIAIKEGKNPFEEVKHSDMTSFPVYDDYEVNPGEGPKNKS